MKRRVIFVDPDIWTRKEHRMTTNDDQDRTQARVHAILAQAVAGLDPVDRAERIAYCRTHNEHGVRMFPATDDDLIEFRWGGRTLAMVQRDVLTATDDPDIAVAVEFIGDGSVPDTVPPEWLANPGGGSDA